MAGGSIGGEHALSSLASALKLRLKVTFLVVSILAENVREDGRGQTQPRQDSLFFATSDLVKSVLSLSIWFVYQRLQGLPTRCSSGTHTCDPPFHEHGQWLPVPTNNADGREPYPRNIATLSFGSVRSSLAIPIVGFVYALRAYTVCALPRGSRIHLPRMYL